MPIPNPDKNVSVETKVDSLIDTARAVKEALDRRTLLVFIAVVVPLVAAALVLWRQTDITNDSRGVAKLAYVQALVNNRDFLQYRRDFAQTRDCPVEYFKALLDASRDKEDLSSIVPPCTPTDLPTIDAQIADVERKIALASR